jgi:heme/copper-type cytochrome/quinol oxidase subunit 4
MATTKEFGVSLLVDTTKQVMSFSTSILGAIFAAMVLKGATPHRSDAGWAIIFAGLSILFSLVFLLYVSERSIKDLAPYNKGAILLVVTCWFPFLLSVVYGAKYGLSLG